MPGSHLHADLTIRTSGREDDDAPTLVLLHGLTDSGASWADAVERWSPDYRVVSWDARGHGESARFLEGQLEDGVGETHRADAIALLENLALHGMVRPVLVGHSMGGGTAAAVAVQRPDLVRAVLLEDPALGARDEPDVAETGARRVAEARATIADPAAALASCRADNPHWPESELAPWLEAKLQTDLAMLADPVVTVATPWAEIAREIGVPALVVTGDGEAIWTGDLLERLRAVDNPLLAVFVVEGANHCVRRDRTEAFHAVVDPWLAARFA